MGVRQGVLYWLHNVVTVLVIVVLRICTERANVLASHTRLCVFVCNKHAQSHTVNPAVD